ncbi:MAG: flagellar biosynthesis protein FlhF [Bacteroidetes bacterium]|nr:flagellar biosynthesis protein FlhF [Bacteroidota bacterium]
MKKFIAPSMKEGIIQMKKELGEDAVILSTRNVKVEGSDDIVEIIAALDDQLLGHASRLHSAESVEKPNAKSKTSAKSSASTPPQKTIPASKAVATYSQTLPQNDDEQNISQAATLLQLRNDVRWLKDTLATVAESVPYRYASSLNPASREVYTTLRAQDFPDEEALRIVGLASAQVTSGIATTEDILNASRQIIASELSLFPPLESRSVATTVAFIGTTGGGKTTTITKLAAICKLLYKANILIVSADTYKVGGAEQLQTFASIAGIAFHTAYSSQELRQIIKQESKRDFIFIDTVGRSQQRRQHLLEIGAYLEAAAPEITYLVQSAATGEQTFLQTLERFGVLEPDALILTKLDESAGLGGILTALRRHKLPLAYYTTGQKIPDDIETARAERLAEIVLPPL